MGTVKLLEYPVYALATDGTYLVTSGGGGGEEFGISDRLEFHSISDVGGRLDILHKASSVDQIGVMDFMEYIQLHDLWMGSLSNGTVFFSCCPDKGVHVYGRVLMARAKSDPQQSVARFCKGKDIFITGNTDGTVCLWRLSNKFMDMMDVVKVSKTDGTCTPVAHTDDYTPGYDLTHAESDSSITTLQSRVAEDGVTTCLSSAPSMSDDSPSSETNVAPGTPSDNDLPSLDRTTSVELHPSVPLSAVKDALDDVIAEEGDPCTSGSRPDVADGGSEVPVDGVTGDNRRSSDSEAEHTDFYIDSDSPCYYRTPNSNRHVAVKLFEYKEHDNEVTDCDICADGNIAVSVSRDKMVVCQVSPPKVLLKQKSPLSFKFVRFVNKNCYNGFYQILTIEWQPRRPTASMVCMWRYTAESQTAILVKSVSVGPDPCSAMCLSLDATYFALGFGTGAVGVYNPCSLQCLMYEQRHQLPVTDVVFLGDKLVSSGADLFFCSGPTLCDGYHVALVFASCIYLSIVFLRDWVSMYRGMINDDGSSRPVHAFNGFSFHPV